MPYLHLTLPSNPPLNKPVEATFGKDVVRVTLLADDLLRFEQGTAGEFGGSVGRILSSRSQDGATTMCIHCSRATGTT